MVEPSVASASPRLITERRRLITELQQDPATAVLQDEAADAIFLLYEIATHARPYQVTQTLPGKAIEKRVTLGIPTQRFPPSPRSVVNFT